jgi:hypothetical protein
MAATITKIVVPATVGPAELAAGRTYVHDIELDGDENLAVGQRVEVRDEAGRFFAATITGRDGARWQLTLRP